METGEALTLNERKIYQYIHPNICESCQLQMGYTIFRAGQFLEYHAVSYA